jgi:hypothetical protein
MLSDNDAEREAQVDEIIERLERLEVEAARLRQLAARLKAANAAEAPVGATDARTDDRRAEEKQQRRKGSGTKPPT